MRRTRCRACHPAQKAESVHVLGTAAFGALNQVRCDDGILEVNVTGSTAADFRLILAGVDEITLSGLILA